MEYDEFINYKTHLLGDFGFKPIFMPDAAFDFQRAMIEYACVKGRSALFEDCGLGKSLQELAWAENVVRHTNGNVLFLTPLAVSLQMVEEGRKFGIDATRSRDGTVYRGITITNYEKLHLFNSDDFVGMVCDESSILKSMDGAYKTLITKYMRKMKYRLLATATPSPNDYNELGTSSEALGHLPAMDMLNKFFRNTGNDSKTGTNRGQVIKFVLRTHAEESFWRWVTSWARALRKPSDMGFDDGRYILPKLTESTHMIDFEFIPDGSLFPKVAIGLGEQREERRRSLEKRCEKVAELVNHNRSALVWCQMNDEGDLLEKMIPDAIQVSGRDGDDEKEEKLLAFAHGESRCMVTKPKIGAWGLNLQHCNHMTFFPSHSYEQYYQGVRRCWRFGQENPVKVDIVTTAGEINVLKNLLSKQHKSDQMFEQLVMHMNNALGISKKDTHTNPLQKPVFIGG